MGLFNSGKVHHDGVLDERGKGENEYLVEYCDELSTKTLRAKRTIISLNEMGAFILLSPETAMRYAFHICFP